MNDYRVDGFYVVAVLRSLARQAKTDAALGDMRGLNDNQRAALRKVARLANEARQTLERA